MRFIVCGTTGAGTSTLINRLLSESTVTFDDQPTPANVRTDLIRECFSRDTRRMVLTDPRNAENHIAQTKDNVSVDLAIVLIDGVTGLLTDAKRHSYLIALLGIRHVIVAINKMDLVEYRQEVWADLEREYRNYSGHLNLSVACVPVSALAGDNLFKGNRRMPWYTGPSLIQHLEQAVPATRVPSPVSPPHVADQFEATILWTDELPMLQGRTYHLAIGHQTANVLVSPLKYKVNIETLEHVATRKLERHDIGVCGIELSRPVVFDPSRQNADLSSFALLDGITNRTLGIGVLHFALRRSENVHWQALDVNKRARAELKRQKPCIVWFTGLSGAGKSTIANVLEQRLHERGCHTYLLDGDNVRHGLNKDLGFTQADRVENVRRVAEVARLMADAGLIVLVSLISPFRAERRMARGLMEEGEFFEVFVDTPLHVAEARDPKNLYRKARRGDLKNFTGVDSPYEVPEAPEVTINTVGTTPAEAADSVMRRLNEAGIVADH